eukprot:1176998-Prorocentrum_minimum.AAC.1
MGAVLYGPAVDNPSDPAAVTPPSVFPPPTVSTSAGVASTGGTLLARVAAGVWLAVLALPI